jgi:hypothetical protein
VRFKLNQDGVFDRNLSARDSERLVERYLDPMQSEGGEVHIEDGVYPTFALLRK